MKGKSPFQCCKIAGPGAELIHDETADRFDVLPLLVATDGAIAACGRAGRRLRPNLVIGGVKGLDERQWPGRKLRIGEVALRFKPPHAFIGWRDDSSALPRPLGPPASHVRRNIGTHRRPANIYSPQPAASMKTSARGRRVGRNPGVS